MIILGLIVFISLYILKLPYYVGLIIIFLGLTFYFSEHRSFTHSIFGVLTLASAISLILIWGFQLVGVVTVLEDEYLLLAVLIVLVGFLFLNKRLLLFFIPLFFVSLFLFPCFMVGYVDIVLSLFLGLFSHVVLDSFTPAGVKIFAPLSSRKVFRNFGLCMIFLLVVLSLLVHVSVLFDFFRGFVF